MGQNPKRQIGGESFSRIFGGNTVDIRPQGAAQSLHFLEILIKPKTQI